MPIAQSTVALYLVPVVAMLLAWVWLGETPTWLSVAGGLLTVGGVVMVQRAPVRELTRYSAPSPSTTTRL